MAAPRRPPTEKGVRGLPAASPGDVPSGAGQPGQGGTRGQEDRAEPAGGHRAGRGTRPQREGELHRPAAKAGLMASLRWPGPPWQPGALGTVPHVSPSDNSEEQSCSQPGWSEGEEARDGDSLVSSGRLSGSSGGHESCAPPHGPWQERPPQVLGPQRQPRKSDPRLERLRERIRAQARWQTSCGSLGTSVPSSASRLCRPPRPAPQKKVCRVAHAPPAPAYPGFSILRAAESKIKDKASPGQGYEPFQIPQRQASAPRGKGKRPKSCSCKREKAPVSPSPRRAAKSKDPDLVGVSAWKKGQALVRSLLGPPPALPRFQSKATWREPAPTVGLGRSKKVRSAEVGPRPARTPSLASACSDPQASTHAPSQASRDQPATIENAMSILRDLRQQIQAGLDRARDPHRRQRTEPGQLKLRLQDPAGRRQWGSLSTPNVQVSLSKRPWATTSGKSLPLEGAWRLPAPQPWSASPPWESHPRRAWVAEGQDSPFQRPASPRGRQGTRLQRPWSASAGQVSQPERAWDPCEAWDAPARSPWSPRDRRSPPAQQPCSASLAQKTGAADQGGGCAGHPGDHPGEAPRREHPGERKEQEEGSAPCRRPRAAASQPHSAEAVREFMRQRALARRRQVLEEKAAAARAREQREQRLREVYRRQREAVLGRAAPVVSHASPGIVTFVPRPAPSGGAEAPRSLDSPVLEWSKVTSGVVLGDQEAQGSFCLFLNKALNRPDALQKRDAQDSGPLLVPGTPPPGPLRFGDLALHYPSPGLCIYLDSEEAESLGMSCSPHLQYKRARLQALESMASVLKQRIDVLTAKLHRPEGLEVPGDPAPGLPSPRPGTVPAATAALPGPAYLGALMSPRERGLPQGGAWGWTDLQARPLLSPTCFLDSEVPWESQHLGTPWNQHTSRLSGFPESGHANLERRLATNASSFHAVSPWAGSSLGLPSTLDPFGGSLRLEEVLAARGVDALKTPTFQSCGEPEAGSPRGGHPRTGHLAHFQQKPLSFLESLKQRTQKHETQARLEPSASLSTGPAAARAHLPWGGEAAAPSRGPEPQGSQLDKVTSAGLVQEAWRSGTAPSQLPPARLHHWDHGQRQDSTSQCHPAGSRSADPGALGRTLALQLLRQSLREEELRAQHQAALLRLREKALEEKGRTELAWLEHRRGCLESEGDHAAMAALLEQQQRVLATLQQEQKEIQNLRDSHLWAHRERKLLLRLQEDILSLQQSTARLRHHLWAPATLPQVGLLTWLEAQSSRPEAEVAQERDWETSWQQEGWAEEPSCPQTRGGPSGPTSYSPLGSPQDLHVTHLPAQRDSMMAPQASSVAKSPWQPPRPAWGEDTPAVSLTGQDPGHWPPVPLPRVQPPGSPGSRGAPSPASPTQPSEAEGGLSAAQLGLDVTKKLPPGDPWAAPSPVLAGEKILAGTKRLAQDCGGQSWLPTLGDGPSDPQEQVAGGSVSLVGPEWGLDAAGSPPEWPHEVDNQWPEEQRRDPCGPEDPSVPCGWREAAQLAASPAAPAAPEGEPSPSPLPRPSPAGDLSSESIPVTCLGSSEASAFSSTSSVGSLEGFQRASATLVLISGSPNSLTDLGAGSIPDTDVSASWEDDSCTVSESLRGVPTNMAVAGGPGLPLPSTPSPGLGSELSEASSEIWQDLQGQLPKPGARAVRASGGSPPAGDLSATLLPQHSGQGASGASESPAAGQKKGKPAPDSPAPSEASSTSDLDAWLSFPSGTSASEAEFDRAEESRPHGAAASRREGPLDTGPGLSPLRKPEPEVPTTLQAPAGDPRGLTAEEGAHSAQGDAASVLAGSMVAEILSPVDEVLSYGSADLPPPTHRDARPSPPPEPALQADSETPDASTRSEDFPPPPEALMFPGEDTSLTSEELSSWSEERPLRAGSPRPQEPGCCLGGAGQDGHLVGESGEPPGPVAGTKAMGEPQPGPSGWPGSPPGGVADTAPEGLPRSSVQSLAPSRLVCAAMEGLPRPLVVGGREHARHPSSSAWGFGAPILGAQGRLGDVAQCFEGTEHKAGPTRPWAGGEELLGNTPPAAGSSEGSGCLAKASTEGWDPGEMLGEGREAPPSMQPAALVVPPPGQVPSVAGGLARWLEYAGEEVAGGLGSPEEGQPRPKDPPAVGCCPEGAEAVDLVSTQLTHRILCDTLATLSELATVGSPRPGEAP